MGKIICDDGDEKDDVMTATTMKEGKRTTTVIFTYFTLHSISIHIDLSFCPQFPACALHDPIPFQTRSLIDSEDLRP